jgi:hypothetical protein
MGPCAAREKLMDAEARRWAEDLVQPSSLLEPVPYGYCRCRCGGRTPIATRTDQRYGHVKGQPVRFIIGHNARIQYGSWAERLWSKVDKNGPVVRPQLGPCWLWTGYRDEKGYGWIETNGRNRPAHHVALELAGFIIPAEFLQVRHLCHNPPCVRVDHLKIGTPQDDANDKVAAGRQARGERVHSKLWQGAAGEIRRLYAAGGISQRALAKQFGVTQASIGDIVLGKACRHIGPREEL